MSIWIIIALLTAVWGLASLPRDIRDENKLQITLDIALINDAEEISEKLLDEAKGRLSQSTLE